MGLFSRITGTVSGLFELLGSSGGPIILGQAPGTPAYNPTWYALTDIYLDPVAGLDTNSGQVGFPIKTRAEMVRRYGSTAPALIFGQSLTVHQLSAQTINVDVGAFNPIPRAARTSSGTGSRARPRWARPSRL